MPGTGSSIHAQVLRTGSVHPALLPSHRAQCLVLSAGFETTGHSVAWALYEIALNPQVQSKLADELAGAGLLWAPGRPRRPLEQSDLSTLRYLDQVCFCLFWQLPLTLCLSFSLLSLCMAFGAEHRQPCILGTSQSAAFTMVPAVRAKGFLANVCLGLNRSRADV